VLKPEIKARLRADPDTPPPDPASAPGRQS